MIWGEETDRGPCFEDLHQLVTEEENLACIMIGHDVSHDMSGACAI